MPWLEVIRARPGSKSAAAAAGDLDRKASENIPNTERVTAAAARAAFSFVFTNLKDLD